MYFVGAGPGAPDLITVRGKKLLERAGAIVYAGSLVNPALLECRKAECVLYDSAGMTLEQVIGVLVRVHRSGQDAVRLHSGDPSLYGAIREQMDLLAGQGVPFEVVPGVSSFGAAAAALRAEYTLPGVSQSLIITRMAGRTPVPEAESIDRLAAHGASMAVFLSAGMIGTLCDKLLAGGYAPHTPAAVVYRASWPDERTLRAPLDRLAEAARREQIGRTALILVGGFLGEDYDRSRLYDPDFSHGYREGRRP